MNNEMVMERSMNNEHIISRVCMDCGQTTQIPCSLEQLLDYVDGEKHVIDIFPNLSADKRELLISGYCGKCFDKMFK